MHIRICAKTFLLQRAFLCIRNITWYNKLKEVAFMPLTPKEMLRLLLQNGFVYVKSNNGSHQKYFNFSNLLQRALINELGLNAR